MGKYYFELEEPAFCKTPCKYHTRAKIRVGSGACSKCKSRLSKGDKKDEKGRYYVECAKIL